MGPDYFEMKKDMEYKQYENLMNILRKTKNPGWTSDQLKFIVGSKSINEKAMDTNLDRIGINQKNKKRIKDTTVKTNIHSLLNILKVYYANTHQEEQRPMITDGADQHSIDIRQTLGKRPTYEDRNQAGTHLPTSPVKKNRTPQPLGSEYTSLIPQVNYTEGPP